MSLMTLIIIAIVFFIVIGILFFIARKIALLALVLGIIYLVFHVGFVWDGSETAEKLSLDRWLKPEVSEHVEGSLNSISEKRNELAVIEPEEMGETVDYFIEQIHTASKEKLSEVDMKKLAKDLEDKFKSLTEEEQQAVVQALKEHFDEQSETMD